MQYTRTGEGYLVRLDTDEEIIDAVTRFANDRRIDTGIVSGIGSLYKARLGYFDRSTREYISRNVEDDCEIVSLLGNLALKEGRAFPHLHVTLGTRDFQAIAGHLFEGRVAATCEIFVRSLAAAIERHKDEKTGLFLLDV